MGLSKEIILTVKNYEVNLDKNIKFYENDTIDLCFSILEYGIEVKDGVTVNKLMPINALKAYMLIETPQGVDYAESTIIEDNRVVFNLGDKYSQFIGIGKMQIVIKDSDGCRVTLPEFPFEIRQSINSDWDRNITVLSTEASEIIVDEFGREIALKKVSEMEEANILPIDSYSMILDNNENKKIKTNLITQKIENDLQLIDEQLDTIIRDKDGYVSVKSFLCDDGEFVKGDGVHDDTTGIKKALENYTNIRIPAGNYLITSPLKLKPSLNLCGEGSTSSFILDLEENEYCLENAETNLTRFQINNLRFVAKDGSNTNVGAISFERAMRGCVIRNIWCENMAQVFYIGSGNYAITTVENIFATYFHTNTPSTKAPAITVKGNTVFMKNVEIAGSYHIGLKLEGAEVFSLRDFNICGSENYKMDYAIYSENSKNVTIDRGWIEQLAENEHGTGGEYGIYLKKTEGEIKGALLVNGSIYVDDCTNVLCIKNNFYTPNGGIRRLNGGSVKSDINSIGASGSLPKVYQDGDIIYIDSGDNTNNILHNPTLKSGCDISFIEKKDNTIILSDSLNFNANQTDDRTIDVTIPSNISGEILNFKLTNLVYQNPYTLSVRLKTIENVKNIYLELPNGVRLRNGIPSTLINTKLQKVNDYYTLKVGFISDYSTARIKLIVEKNNVTLLSKFNLDSCMLFNGYSSCNFIPSYKNNKLYSTVEPTTGKWEVGDIVYNIAPDTSSKNFIGWVCNYVEGGKAYWKKFGTVLT